MFFYVFSFVIKMLYMSEKKISEPGVNVLIIY